MKKEKTMHELAKEFPDKTYRELEKYRDAQIVRKKLQQIPYGRISEKRRIRAY